METPWEVVYSIHAVNPCVLNIILLFLWSRFSSFCLSKGFQLAFHVPTVCGFTEWIVWSLLLCGCHRVFGSCGVEALSRVSCRANSMLFRLWCRSVRKKEGRKGAFVFFKKYNSNMMIHSKFYLQEKIRGGGVKKVKWKNYVWKRSQKASRMPTPLFRRNSTSLSPFVACLMDFSSILAKQCSGKGIFLEE